MISRFLLYEGRLTHFHICLDHELNYSKTFPPPFITWYHDLPIPRNELLPQLKTSETQPFNVHPNGLLHGNLGDDLPDEESIRGSEWPSGRTCCPYSRAHPVWLVVQNHVSGVITRLVLQPLSLGVDELDTAFQHSAGAAYTFDRLDAGCDLRKSFLSPS